MKSHLKNIIHKITICQKPSLVRFDQILLMFKFVRTLLIHSSSLRHNSPFWLKQNRFTDSYFTTSVFSDQERIIEHSYQLIQLRRNIVDLKSVRNALRTILIKLLLWLHMLERFRFIFRVWDLMVAFWLIQNSLTDLCDYVWTIRPGKAYKQFLSAKTSFSVKNYF